MICELFGQVCEMGNIVECHEGGFASGVELKVMNGGGVARELGFVLVFGRVSHDRLQAGDNGADVCDARNLLVGCFIDELAHGVGNAGVQVGIGFAAWNARLFEGLSSKKAGIIFSDFFAGECGEVAAFEFAQVIFYFGHDMEYIAYPFGCLMGAFLGAGVEAANVKVFSEAFANEHGLLFAPRREGQVGPPAVVVFAVAFSGLSMAD